MGYTGRCGYELFSTGRFPVHGCRYYRRTNMPYKHARNHARLKAAEEPVDAPKPGALEVCTAAINSLMQAVSAGESENRLDCFLEFVSDSLLDKAIEAKKGAGLDGGSVRFSDILELMRVGDIQVSDLLFDSYAMRALVLQQPSEVPRLLSSLMLSEDRSLHRFISKAGSEEIILTVNMHLSEGLVGQFRGSPRITPLWRLKSISGESDWGEDLPAVPGLAVGPETVVQGQLEALKRGDIAGVYTFASPLNKFSTGPLANFSRLFDSPQYKPLLSHSKSESLRRIQLTDHTYAEVVGIVSENTGVGRPAKIIYVWSVGKVPSDSGLEEGGFWMVNSVQLVSASTV